MFQQASNLNLLFYTCGRCPTGAEKNAHLCLCSLPLSIPYAPLHLGSILYSKWQQCPWAELACLKKIIKRNKIEAEKVYQQFHSKSKFKWSHCSEAIFTCTCVTRDQRDCAACSLFLTKVFFFWRDPESDPAVVTKVGCKPRVRSLICSGVTLTTLLSGSQRSAERLMGKYARVIRWERCSAPQ